MLGAGAGVTVKVALFAEPRLSATAKGPLLAPEGTTAVSWVSELTAKLVLRPFRRTWVVPVKPEPLKITDCPT